MSKKLLILLTLTLAISFIALGCGNTNFLNNSKPIIADPCDPEVEDCSAGKEPELHPIFKNELGEEIPMMAASTIQPDSTGLYPTDDYDGDGIPNDKEIFTNKFVANYPKIVTRIAPPIQMEIEVDYSTSEEDHVEFIEEDGLKDTITNSMENKQYSELNKKTTPYVTKESFENSASSANAYGYENSEAHSEAHERSSSREFSNKIATGGNSKYGAEHQFSEGQSNSNKDEVSDSRSAAENSSVEKMFQQATMTEKTVFEDVDYVDNMDRNGVEFTSDTVQSISRNFRNRKDVLATSKVGPNAGRVTAGLFIRNTSIDMPVKVSNIRCTLSFRTPSGENLPVQTFMLRNDDYSILEDVVTGGEELGPYTVSVNNLKTDTVQKALARGYMPQIHVVSYTMEKVEDSSYDPGVDNLKMVEEASKSRTAAIKISGSGLRELYRVCAFDVKEGGIEKNISPGISLKKALFNVFADKIGDGESFIQDSNGQTLTVPESGLRWKPGADDRNEHKFSSNKKGNSWRLFETFVKAYTDEFNNVHYIETIKRIGSHKKYNPFNVIDNPSYDPNELLTNNEFYKTKYWIILHNGQYFEGDINDPIWAGERYEIICIDLRDFNNHFAYNSFFYSPIQTNEPLYLNTRWNNQNNEVTDQRIYPRGRYLGKIVPSDVINLEINLIESRSLFNVESESDYVNIGLENREYVEDSPSYYNWFMGDLPYNFAGEEEIESGIPGEFSHTIEGGVNSIKVELTNSKNAHTYEISFPGSSLKTVRVLKSEVAKNNGIVFISRETESENGTVGFIQGNKIYDVHVTAYGKSYGYDIPKESMFNNTSDAEVFVHNPEQDKLPNPFSFKASSTMNQLNVAVSDAENTEYFLLRYKGPLNLGVSPEDEGTTVLAHAGLNQIRIKTPKGSSTGDDKGLYSIEVVSVNMNSVNPGIDIDLPTQFENLINNTSVSVAPQYVLVDYDRFAVQKEELAAKTGKLYDLKVLDNLEVNFNDGSGWYKLIFTNTDTFEGRKIDCRKSSYMNFAEQKFNLSFKPPRGVEDAFGNKYNVFTGGNSEVDLYIRTIAEEKYRDRFWLKPDAEYENGKSFISTPEIENGIIDYWLNDGYFSTDATDIEDTVYQNSNFVDKDIDNYFFSPVEYYSYSLRASITDVLSTSEELCPDPVYTATAGENSIDIIIDDIGTAGVDYYDVYWKIDTSYDEKEDLKDFEIWSYDRYYTQSFSIPGLPKNTDYIVVVKSGNDFMESSPVVKGPIRPYSYVKPDAPQYVMAAYDSFTNSIVLDFIFVDGEYRYEVEWKTKDAEVWKPFPPYGGYLETKINYMTYEEYNSLERDPVDNSTDGTTDYMQSAVITNGVSTWKGHDVRVRAVTGGPDPKGGEWWYSSDPLCAYRVEPVVEMGPEDTTIAIENIYAKDSDENIYDVYYINTDVNGNPLSNQDWKFFPDAYQPGIIKEFCIIPKESLIADNFYKIKLVDKAGSAWEGREITSSIIKTAKLDLKSSTYPRVDWFYDTGFRKTREIWKSKRVSYWTWKRVKPVGAKLRVKRTKTVSWKEKNGWWIYNKLKINFECDMSKLQNVDPDSFYYEIVNGTISGETTDDDSGHSENRSFQIKTNQLIKLSEGRYHYVNLPLDPKRNCVGHIEIDKDGTQVFKPYLKNIKLNFTIKVIYKDINGKEHSDKLYYPGSFEDQGVTGDIGTPF